MKTHLLCLLLFLLSQQHSSSQADLQWLISNRKGKSGLTITPTATSNQFENTLTSPFTLEGVSVPNISGDPRRRNELFIIYTDGTNTNTWDNPVANNFFDGTGSAGTTHPFNPPAPPAYLYLTNRYEEDDPRGSVRAKTRTETNPIPLPLTTSGLLSSSHEVVIGRDITLIIDYNQLPDQNKENPGGSYTLEFNGLRPKNDTTIYPVDFMDLMPVFAIGTSTSAVYTNYQVESGANATSIVLQPGNAQYEYVNLRNNARAYAYGPTGNTPNYYANFTIKRNGVAVAPPLERAILNSYDPNFLQVLSISEESDHYVVKYHLEFENTSTSVAAETLKVKVILPTGFQLPHAIEWVAKHTACHGRMDPIPGESNGYEFTFESNDPIIQSVDPNSGIAFIEFKVKVTGIDVANADNSLRLGTPTVQFDSNDPYPVTEFRDLVNCAPENSRLSCARPVTMATSKCMDMLCWVFLFAAIIITIAVIVGLLILLQISRYLRNHPRP